MQKMSVSMLGMGVRAASLSPVACSSSLTSERYASGRIVLVDGVRTPFQMSGTGFQDLTAHQLQTVALRALLDRNPSLPKKDIDHVICGTVIQEVKTSNIAREASLAAGIPDSVPSHTLTQACISSNQAIAEGVGLIASGAADIIIAGGVETMSDVPIRFSRKMRRRMLNSRKAKGPAGFAKLMKGFSVGEFAPELPAIAEFSTNETMGTSADRLATRFGVTRNDQDEYALRSHQNAAKAIAEGKIKKNIAPVYYPKLVEDDNGVKGDSSMEKLGKLKPAFIKPYGTITAANASFLTDGASACFVMSEEKAKEYGLTPMAYLHSNVFVAQDPNEQLLLGPAYAIQKILARNNMSVKDIDVFEFHEAFAGQVLANVNALNDEQWCQENMGTGAVGALPMDKFNLWGGSLSIGHPFGATGVRLAIHSAQRLKEEDGKYALIAACAAGGQGVGMILERHPDF